MDSLPQYVIDKIFCRLPVKDIGRSRCVSKHLRCCLSNPEFIKTHFKLTKHLQRDDKSLILLYTDRPSASFYAAKLKHTDHMSGEIACVAEKLNFDHPRFPPDSDEIYSMKSCDGLILLECSNDISFLFNPTTREIKEFSSSPYEQTTNSRVCGLGYDSVNDDYKIVAISNEPNLTDEWFVNIYSARNGSWRKVGNLPYWALYLYNIPSLESVDGCLHFPACETRSDSPFVIAAFDLGEERFIREVSPPSSFDSWHFKRKYELGFLDGCLCMLRLNNNKKRKNYLWMMKEYNSVDSWTRFTINNPEKAELQLLCMLKNENVVVMQAGFFDHYLAMCNLEEATLKHVVIHGIPNDQNVRKMCTFMESLVSPHCDN